MKKIIVAAALAISAMCLGGCSKDDSGNLTGSYSYKTSGTVTLMAKQLVGLDAATLAAYKAAGVNVDPLVIGLYPEQGQMHILDSKEAEGEVIITFNDLLGNADVADGTVRGDSISISGTPLKTAQLTDGKEKLGAGIVQYSGTGRKYDDMLIFALEYKGEFTINNIPMVVVACDVRCVAQKN